jgi:hypothetical protein
MTSYDFHTIEDGIARDGTTVELSDLEEAKELASKFAGDLLKEVDGLIFRDDLGIEVTDASESVLLSIAISGYLSIESGEGEDFS